MRRSIISLSRGFSFIEAVLCIGVFGAAVTGVLVAYQASSVGSMLSDQQIIALNIARDTMEQIHAQRDCNQSGCGYSSTLTSINNNSYNANPVSGFSNYVLTVTVSEVAPDGTNTTDSFLTTSANSGYARVTVQVTWNNSASSIKLVSLLTSY